MENKLNYATGYPNPMASQEDKKKKEFGIRYFKKMYAGIKKNTNYGIRASRPETHSGHEALQENKQLDRWKLLAGIK